MGAKMRDDWLKASCVFSFLLFALFSFGEKDGSTFARTATNIMSLFGLLTFVLVVALAIRTALRWKRQK